HVFAQPIVIAKKATQTYKALQQHHYAPRQLDDSLSNQVYQQFLTAINIDGLLFSKEDASPLSKHQFKIDEYIPAENTSFLTEASAFLQSRLQDYLQFLKNEENTAIVFPKEAYWPIGNAGIPENKESLKTQRIHFVLAEVLNRIMRSGKDFSEVNTTAPELKKAFLNQEIKRIKNLQIDLNAFIEDSFLNALCLVHDPHSSYLSATNFQRFKHSLSSQSLSFGLIFEEDWLGRIVIQNIIPGSSAQKSDSLFVGDQLIQVMIENGVSVDLASGDYLNELEILLDDPTIKTASFTVMSSGQITKSVKLTKTAIDLQENTVSAFLLKGPVTIGYMSLPSFYTQWISDLFMSSANDVAKAIIKMKQENIQGLIVDLRNNGGGSVIEAIDLLGIFIDQGGLF
ncbi:MAG: S41 family peptidase, partial [Cyclobacteriaceae bacterium]|nr:S41 family peptidase [Cyclobacteriaceae bacterium]